MNEQNYNLSKLLDGTPGYSDTKLIICEGLHNGRTAHVVAVSGNPNLNCVDFLTA